MCRFVVLQYEIDEISLILGDFDFVLWCGLVLGLVDVGDALVVIGLLV